jgi:hypothetical protein
MSAANVSPAQTQQSSNESRGSSALAASAQQATSNEKCVIAGSYGLLSRMYPGLSREQAAALVQQKIMLERLRKAATSNRRRGRG